MQWGWCLLPEPSAHPQALTIHGFWRKPGEVRSSGEQQPHPALSGMCTMPGEEQDSTGTAQSGVLHKNIHGVRPLSNSEVSPEEAGQHRTDGALEAATIIRGRQQGHSSSISLPARRRDICIQAISWVQIHSLRPHR